MTKKKIILSVFFSIICMLCCCLFVPNDIMPVYAYSVSGNKTDTFSFSSSGESSSAYWKDCVSIQSENKLCTGSNIKIKYDKKATSTNNVGVYQEVKSVTVSTNSLPGWSPIGSGHSFNSGTLYVEIWKDGTHQESLSATLNTNTSATIDMSGLTDKYSYYTFKVVYLYKIDWWSFWNDGSKYIHYLSQDFKCQTKDISAKFTKTVYDVNSSSYTNSISSGGTYKTDNTNMYFQWGLANYDDNSTDTVNVYGSLYYSDGKTIVSGFSSTNNGKAGHHLLGLANGTYICQIQAEPGKTVRYTLIIEPFDPLLSIESGVRKDNVYCIEYNSKISWTDTASVKNVKINGHEIANGSTIQPGSYGIEWGIQYKIIVTRTTDATEEYTFVFTNKEQVDLNANQNSLTKSPISRWYETYLLETEEKTYNSWASYENALNFAIQRENNTVTQDYWNGETWTAGIGIDDPLNRKIGYYYIYKQRDDSDEKNAYFSKEALDSAILQYAQASISNNTYFSKSAPSTPYSGEQLFKIREENGNNYNLFLLGEFTLSKRPYVDLWINGNLIDFGYNQTVTFNTPGTYEIEEINPFGDKVTYYIYIQRTAPEIQYTMKDSSLTNILTATNSRFGSYFDLTLFDLDDDSLLVVEKAGIGSETKVYTYSELLDILNSDKSTFNYLFNASGQYTVTSINHWTAFAHINPNSFTFYVSVNEPFINEPSVDKEKNELTLSFSIPVGEYNTQITSVDIKKYNIADGSWVTLSQDSKGTIISPDKNTYIFNTQGYYLITIVDNFGREFSREYAFSREKPSAVLTVGNIQQELSEEQVGYFNKRVTITWYDNTITAKMYGVAYTWNEDGVMIKQNLNASDYISGTAITSEGYYIIELLDIDYNSRRFTFFIDQKAPTLDLYANDNLFESGGYKNSDVSTSYDVGTEYETPITVSLTKDTFPISYPDKGLFVEEGFYKITLIDGAGNSNSYEFTIDKTAPEGQLFLQDGTEFTQNGITNKGVYVTWVEEGVTATCNDDVYYKGSVLTTRNEENYRITLTDKAGNTSVYTFKISQNIPIVMMRTTSGKTIANNTTVDEAFIISWEDPNYTYKIEIIRNGVATTFSNYSEMSAQMFKFEESGSYRFTFTNAINNTYIYSVNANMRPSAIITAGVDNLKAYEYTNKNVSVTISDRNAIIQVFKLDLTNNDYKTYTNWTLDGFKFTIIEDGSYKVLVKNDFDLENNYYFTIKTSLPVATITDAEGNQFDLGNEVLGTVKVNYDKEEVADYKVYLNGELYYGEKEEFTEVGRYIIYLTDKAGNQNTYSFTIKASDDLNWAGIVTLVAMFTALIGVGVFLFLKFKRPFSLKK